MSGAEAGLRAMWTAAGVPQARQDAMVAHVTEKARSPGAGVRFFTIRDDPAQVAIPGCGASAVQAQAARDQAGRGAILPPCPQKPCDLGLFAYVPDQPELLL